MNQAGFGFDVGEGFDFGGQSGFNFDAAQHSNDERERRRRHEEAENKRRKAEREERQRQDREQRERQRQSSRCQGHWETLGVSYVATKKEIRAAWARLCRQHHPDVGGDVEMLKAINRAYEALKGGR